MDGEPIKSEVVTEIRVKFRDHDGSIVEATATEPEKRWKAANKGAEQRIEAFASWERTQREGGYIHSPLLCMAAMAKKYLKAEITGKESYFETYSPDTIF
jgi:hypothetical protein